VFQIQIQLDDRTSKIVTSNASKLFQQKLSPINNEKLNKTGWWLMLLSGDRSMAFKATEFQIQLNQEWPNQSLKIQNELLNPHQTEKKYLRSFAICLPYLTWDCITQLSTETGYKAKLPKRNKCPSPCSKYWQKSTHTTSSTWTNHTAWSPSSLPLLSHPLSFLLSHFHFCNCSSLTA